jgi:hypothetical protein
MCNRSLKGRRVVSNARVALGWLILLSAAPPSAGVQFVYEPFLIGAGPGEYSLGPLPGQPDPPIGPLETGASFFFANWVGSTAQVVQTSNIAPASIGGSVQATGDGRAARYLTTPWDDATDGTFYLSFLTHFGTIDNPNDGIGYRSVELWAADADVEHDPSPILAIGYNQFVGCPGPICLPEPDWRERMQFRVGSSASLLTDYTFHEDGAPHGVVIKFDLHSAPASDTLSVFLDPVIAIPEIGAGGGSDISEPELPNAIAANLDFSLGAIGTASLFGGAAGMLPVFDELRVGTTFADVVSSIPPGGPCSEADYACYLEIISHMHLTGIDVGFGDVTGDGQVTIADYRFWKDRRTDLSAGAGSLSARGIPEPASGVLAVLMAAVFAGAARRSRSYFNFLHPGA